MPEAAQPKAETVMEVGCERFHHLVLENDSVRVFRVEIPAGEETWVHRHERDYVFLILGRAQIREHRQGGEPTVRSWEGMQALYVEGGFVHKVQNLGSEPFRAVIVEVK